MSSLEGKVILITGAFGQAGQPAVKLFLQKGAVVIANDRLELSDFPEIVQLQTEYGPERFRYIKADASEENEVIRVMKEIEHQFGRLDGLFHNVYTNVWKPALELSLAEWESTIKGTLTSTFLANKYALPLMIKSGGGSIVNTSSILGERPQKGCLAYGAGKAGVNQFTRVIAVDYADQGIRANVVVPGDFKSEANLQQMSAETKEMIRNSTLLGRSGSGAEIVEVAAFLLSDAASYVTASLYTVDGGYRI